MSDFPHRLNVEYRPVILSLRAKCECAQNEVLTENVVFDLMMPEEHFVWMCKRLRENAIAEIEAHLTRGRKEAAD